MILAGGGLAALGSLVLKTVVCEWLLLLATEWAKLAALEIQSNIYLRNPIAHSAAWDVGR